MQTSSAAIAALAVCIAASAASIIDPPFKG